VGLFLGVEVVRDRHSQVPAPRIAAAIKEGAKARRVLLSCDGPFDNVIKIKPPMVFGVEEADLLLATLR
jgi:ethanolamine-phosphate phospho-lyase